MEAQRLLKGIIHETPLQASRTFSAMSESQVYLKLENLQKTGAFKIRGAFVKAARLPAEARAKGLITASAGNHAQGVACAAAHFGVPSVIVMPESAPAAKVQATEGYGSKVVLHGANYDEAYRHALQLSEEKGACFVHAFDDEDIISGQGTVGLEILQSLPDVETIVVPVGGGGLISGIAAAVKTLKPEVEIIGVQPEQASSGFLSWQAGQRIIVPAPRSIADGLCVQTPGLLPFEMIRQQVDTMCTVSEAELTEAMMLLLERSKLLVEGAGAAPLAALLSGRLPLKGRKTVLVVSGGNVDLGRLAGLTASRNLVS